VEQITIGNAKISVHHIGGRSGSRTFPKMERFERDLVNVLYDADEDCVAQIEEINKGLESELHVLPFCIGQASGVATLNINYDPYTSSLLESNPEYHAYYYFRKNLDYIIEEVTAPIDRRSVDVIDLDSIFANRSIEAPPPDFLSLDTQGNEYDIMQGARKILKDNVLAVVSEVEFFPIYQGQKLFFDIGQLLDELGFIYVGFVEDTPQQFSPYRAPIGQRGEGFHASGDAMFFKRIESIVEANADAVEAQNQLAKMAFIAIVFNQFEYGLKCLDRAQKLAEESGREPCEEEVQYRIFLRELAVRIEMMPKLYPPTFASMHTAAESQARFVHQSGDGVERGGFRGWLKKRLPTVFTLLRKLLRPTLRLLRAWYIKLIFFRRWLKRTAAQIIPHFSPGSPIESLLKSYGMVDQAKVLRKNRWLHRLHSGPLVSK